MCGLAVLAWALGQGCQIDGRAPGVNATDGGPVYVGNLEPGAGVGGNGAFPGVGEGVDPGIQRANGEVPNSPLTLAPGSLGAACQLDTDCDSGHCVDGVCCDSPCSELCAACNLPGSLGVCSAAPSDPLCPEANCQGQSSECRPLGGDQAGINCQAVGGCRANAECTALPVVEGTPCQGGAGLCDGTGACVVPDKATLGEACAVDADCAEGHCVASSAGGARLCCDAACDGVCQACSAAGRCEVTPSEDARCEAVTCPTDNVCRDYVASIGAGTCRSFGQCFSALDCATPDFFTGLRPTAQCVCDPASGDCALVAGTSCEQDSDCVSGDCVATAQGNRVCCSGGCASGLFCSSSGTGCVQCEGFQVECDGNTQRTCVDGAVVNTACRNGCTPGTGCNPLPQVGFPCDAGRCATGGICQQDTGGQFRCCVRNCAAEGKVCSPSGSCECPAGQVASGEACLLQPGDPCQNGGQCQAGLTCVDGVCCREACGGYCERCQAGTGLCTAVPAGQQEADPASGNSCTNGFECTGVRNGCRARTGEPCSTTDGSDCVSGSCQPTAGGGARVCCSQACGGNLNFCRSNGQGCVQCESAAQCANGCNVALGTCNALRGPGSQCTVAGQCSTNRCVPASDGNFSRCCPNCPAGQLCTPQGQCVTAVNCGGTPCAIANGNACCVRGLPRPGVGGGRALTFSCEPSSGCTSTNLDTPNPLMARPLSCDSPDDCRQGDVCCHEFPVGDTGRTICVPQIQCNTGVNVGLITREQICESPSFSARNSCNPGFFGESGTELRAAACTVIDDIPGWRRCTLAL